MCVWHANNSSELTEGFEVNVGDGACVHLQAPGGVDYVPTEEERRMFQECSEESFKYRCKFLSATYCPDK